MRLRVLGASAVAPNPGGACTGYLLEAGDDRFLVDCGNGILSRLMAVLPLDHLTGVIISHAHLDHWADLLFLRQRLVHSPHRERDARLPLYVSPEFAPVLAEAGALFADGRAAWDGVFDVIVYDPAATLKLGELNVTFAPTRHYLTCYGMRFEHGGRVLVYTADTGPTSDLQSLVSGAHVLLTECALPRREGFEAQWGHLAPAEAAELAVRGSVGRLLLTHIWDEYDQETLCLEAQRAAAGIPVAAIREGDVYEI